MPSPWADSALAEEMVSFGGWGDCCDCKEQKFKSVWREQLGGSLTSTPQSERADGLGTGLSFRSALFSPHWRRSQANAFPPRGPPQLQAHTHPTSHPQTERAPCPNSTSGSTKAEPRWPGLKSHAIAKPLTGNVTRDGILWSAGLGTV